MANSRREDGPIIFYIPKLNIVTVDESASIVHLALPPHHELHPDDILTVLGQKQEPITHNGDITTGRMDKAVVTDAADLQRHI